MENAGKQAQVPANVRERRNNRAARVGRQGGRNSLQIRGRPKTSCRNRARAQWFSPHTGNVEGTFHAQQTPHRNDIGGRPVGRNGLRLSTGTAAERESLDSAAPGAAGRARPCRTAAPTAA